MIIGQGVPEIQGVTDGQTQFGDLLYRFKRGEGQFRHKGYN